MQLRASQAFQAIGSQRILSLVRASGALATVGELIDTLETVFDINIPDHAEFEAVVSRKTLLQNATG